MIFAAAPRIINITVSSNGDHTFQARCMAEGEPAPTLTWSSPHHSNLTSVTSTSHRVTKELQYLTHDGKYTCTAVNSHGRAEGAVYFYKFRASNSSFFMILIFVPLGIKVLVLLVILSLTVFSKGTPSLLPSVVFLHQFGNHGVMQQIKSDIRTHVLGEEGVCSVIIY